ncbi:MAG: geranylgeranyl reductase family protein [Anaerolineaceae bacterium]|nr:geranylgeranyl reductase family protein [Anaerolineaceae bacterium]
MIYDAIVVGSGPGGAIAASELVRRGHSVLMVDRAAFPRDKVCGDGMPSSVIQKLTELDIKVNSRAFQHQRIEGIYLQSYSGRSLVIPERPSNMYSMVAPRLNFDYFLHQHALACGVRFEVMDVVEPLLENGSDGSDKHVVGIIERRGTQRVEHEARVVIAADGASSVIVRGLRGRVASPEETAVAIRAYGTPRTPAIEPLVRFYYLRHLTPGYGWIFPAGESRVNVGLGLFDQAVYKAGRKDLKTLLAEFLDSVSSEFSIELDAQTVKSWPIPVWTTMESRVVNGAYLVGDAGRFADALTGGGIFPAIVTGHLAAIAVDRHLHGASLSDATRLYDESWRQGLGRSLKRLLTVRDTVIARPRVFDGVMLAGTTLPFTKKLLLSNLAGQHA